MCKGVFSDLDRTLVFSGDFLISYMKKVPGCMKSIQYGADLSGNLMHWYMNENLFDYLMGLSEEKIFIPVTARSVEGYLELPQISNNVKYAVASCGGNLLINGEVDKKYRESLSVDIDKLEYIAKKLMGEVIDNSYVSATNMDWGILKEFISDYKCEVDGFGFVTVMPKNIGKASAVEYITDNFGIDCSLSCGDSQHDIGMLSLANIGALPSTST